jgi:hypothetical protein
MGLFHPCEFRESASISSKKSVLLVGEKTTQELKPTADPALGRRYEEKGCLSFFAALFQTNTAKAAEHYVRKP